MATEMTFKLEAPEDGKAALAQLKLKKKELAARKAEIAKAIAEVRANHRSSVAQAGSKMLGSGHFAKALRAAQTISRDSARRKADQSVRSLETKRDVIDEDIRQVDQPIIKVERWLVENAPTKPKSVGRTPNEPSVIEQLERLAKLKEAGVLTDAEFNKKKRELLDRL